MTQHTRPLPRRLPTFPQVRKPPTTGQLPVNLPTSPQVQVPEGEDQSRALPEKASLCPPVLKHTDALGKKKGSSSPETWLAAGPRSAGGNGTAGSEKKQP